MATVTVTKATAEQFRQVSEAAERLRTLARNNAEIAAVLPVVLADIQADRDTVAVVARDPEPGTV